MTMQGEMIIGRRALRGSVRFLRPVCYQNVPGDLLPEALRDDNPLGLTRMVDGRLRVAD